MALIRRRSVRSLGALVLCLASACHQRPKADAIQRCCIDLLQELPKADIRPVNRAPDALRISEADVDGHPQATLSLSVPTRVVFNGMRIPRHAAFSTALAVDAAGARDENAGIAFRIGISDDRTYEQLFDRSILVREGRDWLPVRLDLSRYAGWQWSLFYHPSNIAWSITLNTYPIGAGSARLRGLWAAPAIRGTE